MPDEEDTENKLQLSSMLGLVLWSSIGPIGFLLRKPMFQLSTLFALLRLGGGYLNTFYLNPWLVQGVAQKLMRRRQDPAVCIARATVPIAPACQAHDSCFDRESCASGGLAARCDRKFLEDLLSACQRAYVGELLCLRDCEDEAKAVATLQAKSSDDAWWSACAAMTLQCSCFHCPDLLINQHVKSTPTSTDRKDDHS